MGGASGRVRATMYQPDARDRVRRLPDLPQADVGAPLPVMVADEHRALLAYHACPKPTLEELREIDMPQVVDTDVGGTIAVVTLSRLYASSFGPPIRTALQMMAIRLAAQT